MNLKQASAALSRLSRTGKSLSRGYIDGRVPAWTKRTPPARPWRAFGAPKVYLEGGKLINEFEAGLSRPKTALAGRKILIQRVYRRAMAGTRGALAPRAALAGVRVEAGLRRATGRLQVDVGGDVRPLPTIP